MRNMRKIMVTLLATVVLSGMMGAIFAKNNKGRQSDISSQDKRKAEYIFLQAQALKEKDSIADYFDLIKHAYMLDSTNTAISFYYGHLQLLADGRTPAERERGIMMMKKHIDAHPEDYHEATFFYNACMSLGKSELALETMERQALINPNKTEVQMRLATAYVRNQKYAQALKVYEKIEEFEGRSIETAAFKVILCREMGDTAQAIEQMHKLYDEAPSNVDYNLAMSELFTAFNMNDSALHYLDKAQQLDPDNGNVYFAKALYYDEIGDSINYDKEIYNALVSRDIAVETKLDVLSQYTSTQLMRNDSTQRVNNLFKVLIEQHPHETKVHELYSQYLYSMKDYTHAAEELGYQLDLDPTNADAWQRLMVINIMTDKYPQAVDAAQKALEFNPDNVDLYRYIAMAYFQMKDYDKALSTYDSALNLVDKEKDNELYSDLLGVKGDVMVETGDTTAGFQCYDAALEICPGNTSVMNNYAYFLALGNRDLDKAERMAAKAVYANPNNATFIDTYAWVFFKKKDYDMALFYIKQAIANTDEPSADILDHYGDILYASGQEQEAIEQWQKALELDSSNELIKRKIDDKKYYEK